MPEKPQSKFNADALSPEEILALKELERRNRNIGATKTRRGLDRIL